MTSPPHAYADDDCSQYGLPAETQLGHSPPNLAAQVPLASNDSDTSDPLAQVTDLTLGRENLKEAGNSESEAASRGMATRRESEAA